VTFILDKVKFGYADAAKELKECPEIFDKAFYDSHTSKKRFHTINKINMLGNVI